jgi:two-component system LytT family response regulator
MLRIVLIDDEMAPKDIMEYFVVNYYKDTVAIVGTAANIDEGFEVINTVLPDLIFLDYFLPMGYGFELLDRFPDRNFDVVMLTAHFDVEEEAKRYNILGFMNKPIEFRQLQKYIQLAVQNKEARQQITECEVIVQLQQHKP